MPQTLQVMTGTDAEGKAIFTAMEVPTAEELAELQRKLATANREAMERRLKLEAIEAQKPAVTDESNPQATPQPTQAPAVPVVNEDDIVAKALAKLEEKQKAAGDKERELNALIEKHNLNPKVLGVLRQSQDPVAAAAELEQAGLQFAGSAAGNAKKGNLLSDAAKGAFEELGLEWSE